MGLDSKGHRTEHVRNWTLNFKAGNVRLSLGTGEPQGP